MSAPSTGQISASIAHLRSAADGWGEVADQLGDAGDAVTSLQMTTLQAGIFQAAYDAYSGAASYFAERIEEGAAEAGFVARTLAHNATTYEREEAANQHRLTGLY